MADIRAAQSGDFSATSTWVGGVVPGSGDVAFANTFTVTISDTRTVQAISNASGTGITAGGTFSVLNNCNLTCTNANGVVQGATAANCVTTTSLGVGSSATVTASITTGSGSGSGIVHSSAGTLNLSGNVSGSVGGTVSINFNGVGVFNVTGNLAGASNTCFDLNGTGTANITGNVTGGSGGSNSLGLRMNGSGTVNVDGNVTGGSQAPGATNNSGAGTLTIRGTCQSSATQPAIGAGSLAQVTRLSGPFLLGTSGNINPVLAQTWRWAPTQIPTYYEVVASNGSAKRSLFTSDNIPTANYPTQGNVRSGTVYGPNLENTGTLAVPSASSVALGVATDNTTGTAVLTSANVQTALGAFSSGRLSNVATVDSTGAQIQAAVSA